MRWYARPQNEPLALRVAPRLASWNKTDDPDQVRLRAYLADTEALLAESRTDGEWALRLDVGLPADRDLLGMSDLDNFAYPLAYHLKDPGLVSVWCTKQHGERSFVRIDAAREVAAPSTAVLVAKTNASATTVAYKEQIHAAVAHAAELPDGPVRLELSFVVGRRRNWVNLWKQTIDSLDPILGRTNPDRAWHPRDGRITELGMHVAVDPAAGNEIVVGIAATESTAGDVVSAPQRKVVFQSHGVCLGRRELPDGKATAWDVSFPHWPAAMTMSTGQAQALRDALVGVFGGEDAQ
ncbi:hypothetical protein [Mycobacterium sp. shizuoka-1]|uniref:hypothetical protein n=1 Tax=Mycobacterium sp. shizuoka-1 TaxID=2039281 RepID=UPI0018EAAF84|nr:hypothetical protein [Mycobacterium sp. shizuoka-1]